MSRSQDAHVLICDDDHMLTELLRLQLSASGFTTSCAEDGVDALKQLAATRPDALILDMMMPRMDGMAVLHTIRSHPQGGDIVIIVLTARSNEKDIVAALEAGADDYLVKPFRPEEIKARLRMLLDRRKRS